jgi:hypothetical protein
MSYIDVTFERGGQLVKTLAKVYGGWDSTKKSGNQFYDHQFVEYKGDVTLHVRVWMFSTWVVDLNATSESSPEQEAEFPVGLESRFEAGEVKANLAKGRVSISVLLARSLPWITTSNGKPAVDWGPQQIAQYRGTAYMLRHMIVFNLPSTRRGDYKEWDLLPFLPGGLIERNRRKH